MEMTYISQIDVADPDGSIHKLREMWIEQPNYNSTTPAGEHECSIWRPFRATDVDTGEELVRFSANRFHSTEKRRAFTIAPRKTEPGNHP